MDRVVHFEISAKDPGALTGFYENVFGWSVNKWDGPEDYWLATTGEEGSPGIDGALMHPPDGTPRVVVTVEVADLDATIAKVKANGGRVAMEKMAVPMIGWAAYLVDPQGTMIGLMQPDEKAGI
jgi:uncharacterized protein